jgi:hypothetical protein
MCFIVVADGKEETVLVDFRFQFLFVHVWDFVYLSVFVHLRVFIFFRG